MAVRSASLVAATSNAGRIAIDASGVPADRADSSTAPARRRSHGTNAGSDSQAVRDTDAVPR